MLKFQSPGIHCIVSVVLYVSIPMIAYDMEEGFFFFGSGIFSCTHDSAYVCVFEIVPGELCLTCHALLAQKANYHRGGVMSLPKY